MLSLPEITHSSDNLQRCLDRSFWVVFCIKRRAKKRHHLIAHQFIQSAIVVEDRIGGQRVEAVETAGDLSRRKLFRQRCKAAYVDKQNRYDTDLPARGSQFISEGAEVRIFAGKAGSARNETEPKIVPRTAPGTLFIFGLMEVDDRAAARSSRYPATV